MPNYVATTRDLRVDFCRGLALYMILVDHVIGDPVSKFTLRNFGFSDAAEAFVFLSGLSCGIVDLRVLRRVGWAGLTAALSKRVSQIYVYYVLASIAVILILKIAEGAIKNAGNLVYRFADLATGPARNFGDLSCIDRGRHSTVFVGCRC